MHPDPLLQRSDVARAVFFGNAVEQRQRSRPVAGFGGEQRTGIQRLGHVGVGQQQAVHHAPGLGHGAQAQVQAGKVQAHPGAGRVVQQRVFQRRTRGGQVATLCSRPGLAQGLRSAQPPQSTDLFLLRGRELLDQGQRLGGLVVLGQHAHQAPHGVGVVGLPRQHPAVGSLGRVVLTSFHQQVGQVGLGRHFGRVDAHSLLQRAARSSGVAALALAGGLFDQAPVGGTVQRLLPAGGRASA